MTLSTALADSNVSSWMSSSSASGLLTTRREGRWDRAGGASAPHKSYSASLGESSKLERLELDAVDPDSTLLAFSQRLLPSESLPDSDERSGAGESEPLYTVGQCPGRQPPRKQSSSLSTIAHGNFCYGMNWVTHMQLYICIPKVCYVTAFQHARSWTHNTPSTALRNRWTICQKVCNCVA